MLNVVEVPSFEPKRAAGVGRLRPLPDGWRVLVTMLAESVRGGAAVARGMSPAFPERRLSGRRAASREQAGASVARVG